MISNYFPTIFLSVDLGFSFHSLVFMFIPNFRFGSSLNFSRWSFYLYILSDCFTVSKNSESCIAPTVSSKPPLGQCVENIRMTH